MKNYIFISKLTCIVMIILISQIMQAQNNCEPLNTNRILPIVKGEDYTLPTIQTNNTGIGSRASLDDYRMTYFVHGLNGDYSNWSKAMTVLKTGINDAAGNTIFPAYKVYHAADITYTKPQFSIAEAAQNVIGDLDLNDALGVNYDKTDGIIIAHSQGGLVAREMDRYCSRNENFHERKFGGIVTVTTPNQGAQLLNNNREKGMFSGFIAQMADKLSAGPIAKFTNKNVFFALFAEVLNVENMIDRIRTTMVSEVSSYIIGNELPGTTLEYEVGAAKLEVLNDYQPRTRRATGEIKHTDIVPFYVVRDTLTFVDRVSYDQFAAFNEDTDPWTVFTEPVIMRNVPVPISLANLHFFLNDVNDSETFKGLDDEHGLATRFHAMHLEYQAMVDEHETLMSAVDIDWYCYIFGLFGIGVCGVIDYDSNREIRNAYEEGVNFMNKFDRLYRVTIGALVSETSSNNFSHCECILENLQTGESTYLGTYTVDEGENCGDRYAHLSDFQHDVTCTSEVSTYLSWRHKDSDGVVLTESQMDIPQATFTPQVLEESTHMSVRNDKNTEVILRSVLDGFVGEFFFTEQKN